MRGNKHTFFGIDIEIKYNTIKVDTVKHLEDFISMFVEDVSTSVSYPVTKKLFEVR